MNLNLSAALVTFFFSFSLPKYACLISSSSRCCKSATLRLALSSPRRLSSASRALCRASSASWRSLCGHVRRQSRGSSGGGASSTCTAQHLSAAAAAAAAASASAAACLAALDMNTGFAALAAAAARALSSSSRDRGCGGQQRAVSIGAGGRCRTPRNAPPGRLAARRAPGAVAAAAVAVPAVAGRSYQAHGGRLRASHRGGRCCAIRLAVRPLASACRGCGCAFAGGCATAFSAPGFCRRLCRRLCAQESATCCESESDPYRKEGTRPCSWRAASTANNTRHAGAFHSSSLPAAHCRHTSRKTCMRPSGQRNRPWRR